MAALTPAVPDKAEILPFVETALAWDHKCHILPSVVVALGAVETFTEFGRTAVDLRDCFSADLPSQSAQRRVSGAKARRSD